MLNFNLGLTKDVEYHHKKTFVFRAKRFRDQSTPSSVSYKSGKPTLASLEPEMRLDPESALL